MAVLDLVQYAYISYIYVLQQSIAITSLTVYHDSMAIVNSIAFYIGHSIAFWILNSIAFYIVINSINYSTLFNSIIALCSVKSIAFYIFKSIAFYIGHSD